VGWWAPGREREGGPGQGEAEGVESGEAEEQAVASGTPPGSALEIEATPEGEAALAAEAPALTEGVESGEAEDQAVASGTPPGPALRREAQRRGGSAFSGGSCTCGGRGRGLRQTLFHSQRQNAEARVAPVPFEVPGLQAETAEHLSAETVGPWEAFPLHLHFPEPSVLPVAVIVEYSTVLKRSPCSVVYGQ